MPHTEEYNEYQAHTTRQCDQTLALSSVDVHRRVAEPFRASLAIRVGEGFGGVRALNVGVLAASVS